MPTPETERPLTRQLTHMVMTFVMGAVPGFFFWMTFGALPLLLAMGFINGCVRVPPLVNVLACVVLTGGFPIVMLVTGVSTCVQARRQENAEAAYRADIEARRRQAEAQYASAWEQTDAHLKELGFDQPDA